MSLVKKSLVFCAALAACGPTDDDDDESIGDQQAPAITFNAITFNAITFNALSTNALANAALTAVPLASASFDATGGHPDLRHQLRDENARLFMEYLVSCALEPGQAVEWTDPFSRHIVLAGWERVPGVGPPWIGGLRPRFRFVFDKYRWEGAMGLCPEWAHGAPGRECQELVSSCLLARNNAFGVTVRLSTRGEKSGAALPLSDLVPTGTTGRNGVPIASFAPCTGGEVGVARSCGFVPELAGSCEPGAAVVVGAGGPDPLACGGDPIGAATGEVVLRVCAGPTGCNNGVGLGQSEGSCGTTRPAVRFVCPPVGTFSVMSGPRVSGAPATAVVAAAGHVTYPATELAVFKYREGGFFGNLFDPASLHPGIFRYVDPQSGRVVFERPRRLETPVYQNMFSCWSPEWTEGKAYGFQRVCAGPTGELCAAWPIGPCLDDPEEAAAGRCAIEDGAARVGDLDVHECADRVDRRWQSPITVFLAHPCDLTGEQRVLCRRDRELTGRSGSTTPARLRDRRSEPN